MDASEEIAAITENMTICAAIATFGDRWAEATPEEIDDRAREIGYRVDTVHQRRENERNLYT